MTLKPILIADDNPHDVETLRRMFGKWKTKNPIHAVPSGEEAVSYLKGEGVYADRERYALPCLLLLDLIMDGGGGLSVLSWLQTQPTPHVPVIILTGMQHLRQMQSAYEMGAHSFLMKPLDEREISPILAAFKEVELGE